MTDNEQQRMHRYHWRAGVYGHYLRQQGYGADEAARLVIERYPATRDKLQRVADGRAEYPPSILVDTQPPRGENSTSKCRQDPALDDLV